MRSHGRSNLDLGSVGNMDIAESGQSRKPLRSQAVELVDSGLSQGKAATRVGPTRQTVNKWWTKFLKGEIMEGKSCSGRTFCVSGVAKIVCSKTLSKRGQGSHILAIKLTRRGYPISKTAVHPTVGTTLSLKPLKRPLKLKI